MVRHDSPKGFRTTAQAVGGSGRSLHCLSLQSGYLHPTHKPVLNMPIKFHLLLTSSKPMLLHHFLLTAALLRMSWNRNAGRIVFLSLSNVIGRHQSVQPSIKARKPLEDAFQRILIRSCLVSDAFLARHSFNPRPSH